MSYKWVSILGNMIEQKDNILFKGGVTTGRDGLIQYNVGNFICDQVFGGGVISGEIEFKSSSEQSQCGFILYYEPQTRAFAMAGFGVAGQLCSILTWAGSKWTNHAGIGASSQIIPNRSYKFKVTVVGSSATMTVDNVNVLGTTLPYSLPRGQTGIWCVGENDILIKNYKVSRQPGKVFVVMQFTPPYNELYSDVIIPVCEDLGLIVVRADETYGPGLIVADIAQKIIEAKVIIADITPQNPNVYYEVGYAHALNKPTILIAEKPTQLPFDVSPYRVLFYENTIGGKDRVEKGLRKHLEAIQSEWSTT